MKRLAVTRNQTQDSWLVQPELQQQQQALTSFIYTVSKHLFILIQREGSILPAAFRSSSQCSSDNEWHCTVSTVQCHSCWLLLTILQTVMPAFQLDLTEQFWTWAVFDKTLFVMFQVYFGNLHQAISSYCLFLSDDETRIVLSGVAKVTGADYINANYITVSISI